MRVLTDSLILQSRSKGHSLVEMVHLDLEKKLSFVIFQLKGYDR